MMAVKDYERLVERTAKYLYLGRDKESIVDRLMDKGLDESEAFRVIDDARRALRDDKELVDDLEWDMEITDIARDLYDGMSEDDLVEALIDDGWHEDDALELIELASARLENSRVLRRRFDRELDETNERSGEDGVAASDGMITLGWILAVFGGIIFSPIIPIVLLTSRDNSTKSGYKYNEKTRRTGTQMLRLTLIVLSVSLILTLVRLMSSIH